MKYIKLSIEPEDSNTNIYDVIASTSEDILLLPIEPDLPSAVKTQALINPAQFMVRFIFLQFLLKLFIFISTIAVTKSVRV